jgi:hypothetical protein
MSITSQRFSFHCSNSIRWPVYRFNVPISLPTSAIFDSNIFKNNLFLTRQMRYMAFIKIRYSIPYIYISFIHNGIQSAMQLFSLYLSSSHKFRPQTAIIRCLNYAKTVPLCNMYHMFTYLHHMQMRCFIFKILYHILSFISIKHNQWTLSYNVHTWVYW